MLLTGHCELRLLDQRDGAPRLWGQSRDFPQIGLASEEDGAVAAAQFLDIVANRAVDRCRHHDARQETHRHRLARIELAAAQDDVERALGREVIENGFHDEHRRNAVAHLIQTEARIVCRDRDIRPHDQADAEAERPPADGSHDDSGKRRDGAIELADAVERVERSSGLWLLAVTADGEIRTLAGECQDIGIRRHAGQSLAQLTHHIAGESIAFGGTIERDFADAIRNAQSDHRLILSLAFSIHSSTGRRMSRPSASGAG